MLNVEKLDLFYGAAQAVRGVSLAAARGEVTCVLGRNGVGKTTLLRAVIGQQQVRAGSVFFDGQDITALAPHRRARRGIAYVPQGREIFPLLTVRENLETAFAALSRDRRSIPDEIFSLFPVLKDMLRRRGGDLSGGQQQQLAIARSLGLSRVMSAPSKMIVPLLTGCCPASASSRLVLPTPLRPNTQVTLPGSAVSETLRSACAAP